MAMVVSLVGPHGDGQPQILIRATGGYAPDVMNDLVQRAIELYNELFLTELLDGEVAGLTEGGEDEPASA